MLELHVRLLELVLLGDYLGGAFFDEFFEVLVLIGQRLHEEGVLDGHADLVGHNAQQAKRILGQVFVGIRREAQHNAPYLPRR